MTPIDIHGPAEFGAALQATLEAALARNARTLLWVDPDFGSWPLDRPAVINTLGPWLRRPGRRLVLLAERYDRLERTHPRFTQWRRDWSHVIDTREPGDTAAPDLPCCVLDDGPTLLTLWQRDPPLGRAGQDAAQAATAREQIDAVLQRSVSAWPLRPLGL
jgi:hypothetical protein